MSTTVRITAAAEYLGLSVNTLRNYDRDGILLAARDEHGNRVYAVAVLDEFAARNEQLCRKGTRTVSAPSDG